MAAVSSSVPEREYSVDSRLMLSLSWAFARGKATLAELWMVLMLRVVVFRRVVEVSGMRALESRIIGENIFGCLEGIDVVEDGRRGCWTSDCVSLLSSAREVSFMYSTLAR